MTEEIRKVCVDKVATGGTVQGYLEGYRKGICLEVEVVRLMMMMIYFLRFFV